MIDKPTFSFGKNWQSFLKFLNKERIETAKTSMLEFLGMNTLDGKSFLDIGCGSGIFSYAAFLLDANKIISFDVDQFSVECCKYLWKIEKNPKKWEILSGSILNDEFYSNLGKFDIVYSWGVLHHTGQMWRAIENAGKLVDQNGYLFFTIYNKVEGFKSSNFWLKIKKFYNKSPKILKKIIQIAYILNDIGGLLIRFKNPIKFMKNYKKKRGMNYRVDIIDWLGGYPYEFASVNEILKYMKIKFPNYKLINLKQRFDIGNNWYLFKRSDTK